MAVFSDVIDVGGRVARCEFGAAIAMDASFQDMAPDGIAGMGLQGLAQVTRPPLFQALLQTAPVGILIAAVC